MHHDQIIEGIFRFAVLGLKGEQHALPPTGEEKRVERMTIKFLGNFAGPVDGAWDKPTFLQTVDDLVSYLLFTHN
ncbi:hypothetical protein FRC08_005603 [Ceratobasidium sp. 394]|nr:hypothetical protein FRC08_005603 [Ceratobasidium sp. 394]KAG9097379.1 hypothetical protein FS749_006435 [Ceratobasidium sp. UAMH 11750]